MQYLVQPQKGTLRGMHYQEAPDEEAKLVRCTMGAICDVIADLRPDSPTFGKHITVTLSAENRKMLYIPEKFAHGFHHIEGQNRSLLPDVGVLFAGKRARVPMERPVLRHSLAT